MRRPERRARVPARPKADPSPTRPQGRTRLVQRRGARRCLLLPAALVALPGGGRVAVDDGHELVLVDVEDIFAVVLAGAPAAPSNHVRADRGPAVPEPRGTD